MGEGSESVLQDCRILELAAEEDEANSVVFPGWCIAGGGQFCELSPHRLRGSGRGLPVERDQQVEPSP